VPETRQQQHRERKTLRQFVAVKKLAGGTLRHLDANQFSAGKHKEANKQGSYCFYGHELSH